MYRKSTDEQFYQDGSIVIDADGVEVDLSSVGNDAAERAGEAAALAVAQADRATAARIATESAQLTAFAGALVQGSDPPEALPVGSIFVDVMTGIIYKK